MSGQAIVRAQRSSHECGKHSLRFGVVLENSQYRVKRTPGCDIKISTRCKGCLITDY